MDSIFKLTQAQILDILKNTIAQIKLCFFLLVPVLIVENDLDYWLLACPDKGIPLYFFILINYKIKKKKKNCMKLQGA